ncbi:beta propeller repeat protein [Anaerosolibacter carboniphilus]|uniref:Beta propeller repeat protein n=1 Tax=Anaerosolibacter carboniphilus TaxID=1417629 RepID=A0A841L4C4_9FIRM|nr:S-layer homology domain-containing protein [Anaerosolibacter carboniphilus]MBB6217239.1 beta propeller repeat protein [Anaerosolibacter carboniphilus]
MLRKRSALVLILAWILMLTSINIAWGASEGIQPQGTIQVDGNHVVWMSYDSGNWDVYHLNLTGGSVEQITTDFNTQGYSDVWENYIVWQDNRDHLIDGTGYFDIYLYDMTTGIEKKISNVEGNHQTPVIAKNKVVWVDHQGGRKDVMLYDLKNDILKRVSSDGAQAFGVAFDGDIIAWMDSRRGDFDIYMYSLAVGKEERITYGLGDELDPLVNSGKIIWMEAYDGYSHGHMYDTQRARERKLTVGPENHRPIAFSGDALLIIENDKLILNDVNSITDQAIKSPFSTLPKQAFLIGDRVVWYDGKNIIEESIQTALDRAQKTTNTPLPKPRSSDSREYTVKVQENKILVKANEDTVVSSKDGRMTLKVTKGSFEKDVYMILNQQTPSAKDSYIALTPVYTWEIEGNLKPIYPMELTLSYDKINLQGMDKKVCIYNVDADGTLRPTNAARDNTTKQLVTQVVDNGNAALMMYNKQFKDMNSHWAREIVDVIAARYIISGYEDETFRPDKPMTRAEFVTVIMKSMGDREINQNLSEEKIFTDVEENFWAKEFVYAAHQKGWVSGYDGKFNPNQPITREQMVTILMKVLADTNRELNIVNDIELSSFKDHQKISQWAIGSMEKAVKYGIIKGYNNELTPEKNATRAEAAAMLYQFLEKLNQL